MHRLGTRLMRRTVCVPRRRVSEARPGQNVLGRCTSISPGTVLGRWARRLVEGPQDTHHVGPMSLCGGAAQVS